MEKIIDLHVHSCISDGTLFPEEIVDLAIKRSISAVALTDHDSVEGVKIFSKEAIKHGLGFLTGIEISCKYKNDRILHILGLGMDIDNINFVNPYKRMKEARENGLENVLKFVKNKGIDITIEGLKVLATNKYIDRYTVHRYFIKNNICNDAQEVWDKYLDPVPYTDSELIKVENAIKMIKDSGGVAILAHYNKKIGLKGYTQNEMEEHIRYLVNEGLDGIEKYYPSFTESDYRFLDYIINKYNLIYSGGTDFHGENRRDIKIGIGQGDLCIRYEIYKKILNKLKNKEINFV